jgi:hypothetical protein
LHPKIIGKIEIVKALGFIYKLIFRRSFENWENDNRRNVSKT